MVENKISAGMKPHFFAGMAYLSLVYFTSALWPKYNPVIAHRGAWKKNGVPENSIASLKRAQALRCAGSEFDIHLTRDSIAIIHHDAEYHGHAIEKTDWKALRSIPLANGEPLPTLEEYLVEGKSKRQTRLILEIKPSSLKRTQLYASVVYALLQKHKLTAKVTIISFDIEILKSLLSIDPLLDTQYLNGDLSPAQLKNLGIKGLDYHFSIFKTKHPEWIQEAKDLGLQRNVWTVNSESDLKFFLQNRFEQITTNEPELLFRLLKKIPQI
jgi:glycerophosphoryl diester phosphodiesterase